MRFLPSALLLATPALAATCESLAGAKLANASIQSAQTVAAGDFTPPQAPPLGAPPADYKKLPAFCRVQGVLEPSSDSHIEFEVWLPASGWNGRYVGLGNGGFAGATDYAGLASGAGLCRL